LIWEYSDPMSYNRSYFQDRWRRQETGPSMVTLLIWITVVFYLFQGLTSGSLGGMPTDRVSLYLSLNGEGIRNWELWRLWSYMFVHGSMSHIFFNMFGLYVFGRMVEERLGPSHFLNLYMMSGLIGGLSWLVFNWQSGVVGGVVGASGALFGVMMAAAMMFPNERIMLLIPPVPMRMKTFVMIYAGVEVVSQLWISTNHRGGGIAHLAHLGGLLGGFLYMRRFDESFQIHTILGRSWGRLRSRVAQARFRKTGGPDEDGSAPPGEIDRILDKIGKDGLGSLTAEERRTLEKARERLRRR